MNSSSIQGGRHGSAGMLSPDPFKRSAWGVLILFTLTLPAVIVAMAAFKPAPPVDPWAQAASLIGADPSQVYRGAMVFKKTCAVCHGQDSMGLPRLGKPLRNSAYVQGCTDDELFQLIAQGRLATAPENTTGQLMPPRGNVGLDDESVHDAIVFMRSLQDPSQPVTPVEDWVIDLTAFTSGGGGAPGAGGVGRDLFVAACSACHGPSGGGMEGMGKPLDTSEFIQGLSDKDLMTFIKTGRPIWDSMNTTGVDMPPKGGNPAITDEQLMQIIQFLRALNDGSASASGGGGAPSAGGLGHDLFVAACSACHGPSGGGMEGMGKPLNTSEFIQGLSDKEFMTFIKTGRPIWDSMNTTGVDMPPKGGNPAITDEQLTQIIQYLRSLHENQTAQ